MNKDKFVNLREYVYHLTNPSNLSSILSDRKLKSTKILTQIINLEDRDIFLRTRRLGHKEIGNNSYKFSIRDQDPLHRNVAEKNLAPGFIFEDLVYLLNSKVFLTR